MATLAEKTEFVAGLSDGAFASGDPSPITARGIFNAIRTTWRHKTGSESLEDVRVAVQGLGNVGWHLCANLHKAGAKLIVTDVDSDRVAEAAETFSATPVAIDAIYGVDADIFAPCAIGGILNAATIAQLRVRVVAGGANNQLANDQDADALHNKGILYAPDFVANGGGIINVATEILKIEDRPQFVAEKLASALDATLNHLLEQAKTDGVSPAAVAIATVQAKMASQAA